MASRKLKIRVIKEYPFPSGTKCTHIHTEEGYEIIIEKDMIEIPDIPPEGYWRCKYCDALIKSGSAHACDQMIENAKKRKEVMKRANEKFGKQIKEMLGDCDNCDYKKNAKSDTE